MRRRDFITLLGGAATWPLAARAQQGERMRRIGVLAGGAIESAADTQERNAAFAQTLQQLGWTNGDNVRIDYRYGLGNAANVRKYAAELVSLAPDVILASGASVLAPLLQATRTLPIVFVAAVDPVGAGFVESMAQPGGNATGFIQFEYSLSGKWLELLKAIAPGVARAAVLRDPVITAGVSQFAVIQSVASSIGLTCARLICAMLARSSGSLRASRSRRMAVWSLRRARCRLSTARSFSRWRRGTNCQRSIPGDPSFSPAV